MSGGRRGGRSSDPKKAGGLPKRENKVGRRETSSGPVRPPKPEGQEVKITSRALKAGAGRFGLNKPEWSAPRGEGKGKPPRGPQRGEDFGREKAGASRAKPAHWSRQHKRTLMLPPKFRKIFLQIGVM